ncbi:hypothetical protein ACGF0K_37225 [Streptomyces sp. NPDC048156]|uniref:hypothetical protein n=1 Tax=Streptomyces sp. NPDC048156 TaxID=3365502 RepID=UPI0037165CF9
MTSRQLRRQDRAVDSPPRLQTTPGSSRPSPTSLPGTADETFDAFCQCYRSIYLRYGLARLRSPGEAAQALDAALDELADTWQTVLRDPSLPASAWAVIASHVSARQQTPLWGGLVPHEDADMLLLRYRLGLSAGDAAALMGMEETAFTARLSLMLRKLGGNSEIFVRHM